MHIIPKTIVATMSPSDVDGTPAAGRHELEFRIAERAHLGQVEPLELDLGAHPLSHEVLDDRIEDVREREDHADERADTDQLRDELPGVAVEESGDRAVDAVPAAAVIASPVGEEADAQHAPEAARPVD